MNTEKIYSNNAAYQKLEVLKTNRNKRYRYGEFLVEGVRNINEAVKNNWKINSFIYSGEKTLSSWAKNLISTIPTKTNIELTSILMQQLSSKEDTSELLAVVKMREETKQIEFSENPLLVLFDRPSNKGNLGTLLRSCDAFGVDGLIITGHSVDVYDPDVVSSSMGSFFKVPFFSLSSNNEIDGYINELKTKYRRMKTIGTTSHKQKSICSVDLSGPVLFLVGNETDGLNQHMTEICNEMVTIPMNENSSASSINVSCAASIMFFEANRQRSIM